MREAVLADASSVAWPFAEWWSRLTAEPDVGDGGRRGGARPSWRSALIVLAVRQLRPRRRGPAQVELGDAANRARIDVPAMERALRRRIEKDLPGVKTRGLELSKRGDGWWVRLEAELPARDLLGVQARAGGLLAADLARLGGLRLDGVDVVVTRLTLSSRDVGPSEKEDLGMTRPS